MDMLLYFERLVGLRLTPLFSSSDFGDPGCNPLPTPGTDPGRPFPGRPEHAGGTEGGRAAGERGHSGGGRGVPLLGEGGPPAGRRGAVGSTHAGET